jgi:hypothetical protein
MVDAAFKSHSSKDLSVVSYIAVKSRFETEGAFTQTNEAIEGFFDGNDKNNQQLIFGLAI